MNDQTMTADRLIQVFFQIAQKNLGFVFFIFLLCMIYISNNHLAQSLIVEINKKGKQLKELRWDYLTIKSDLMYRSKLTEVLPRAQSLGLHELNNPPYKIIINKKNHQRQD